MRTKFELILKHVDLDLRTALFRLEPDYKEGSNTASFKHF